jgi:hypothetical protein
MHTTYCYKYAAGLFKHCTVLGKPNKVQDTVLVLQATAKLHPVQSTRGILDHTHIDDAVVSPVVEEAPQSSHKGDGVPAGSLNLLPVTAQGALVVILALSAGLVIHNLLQGITLLLTQELQAAAESSTQAAKPSIAVPTGCLQ